ncbi:hypothetical protein Dimus_037877 [Dionaea muscipula]
MSCSSFTSSDTTLLQRNSMGSSGTEKTQGGSGKTETYNHCLSLYFIILTLIFMISTWYIKTSNILNLHQFILLDTLSYSNEPMNLMMQCTKPCMHQTMQ